MESSTSDETEPKGEIKIRFLNISYVHVTMK